MSIYTVHEPPLKGGQSATDPERFAFVRDGFAFWAFLLTPLWMLRHRLWLVLFGYVLVTIALQAGLHLIGASASVRIAAGALLDLLVGFEAATLRRFTLARHGWRTLGIIVGDDLELAERRFFDGWIKSEPSEGLPPVPAVKLLPPSLASSEIVGLFPQSGAPR